MARTSDRIGILQTDFNVYKTKQRGRIIFDSSINAGEIVMLMPKRVKYQGQEYDSIELAEIDWHEPIENEIYVVQKEYDYSIANWIMPPNIERLRPEIREEYKLFNNQQLIIIKPVKRVLEKWQHLIIYDDINSIEAYQDIIYILKTGYLRELFNTEQLKTMLAKCDKATKLVNMYNGSPYENEKQVTLNFLNKQIKIITEELCQMIL